MAKIKIKKLIKEIPNLDAGAYIYVEDNQVIKIRAVKPQVEQVGYPSRMGIIRDKTTPSAALQREYTEVPEATKELLEANLENTEYLVDITHSKNFAYNLSQLFNFEKLKEHVPVFGTFVAAFMYDPFTSGILRDCSPDLIHVKKTFGVVTSVYLNKTALERLIQDEVTKKTNRFIEQLEHQVKKYIDKN
jgi:hypothetical protein